jgi:hypothetical protein
MEINTHGSMQIKNVESSIVVGLILFKKSAGKKHTAIYKSEW